MVRLVATVEETADERVEPGREETVWGLTVPELYDAYWRARGVQVVRQGETTPLERGAELYMLIEPNHLALFDLKEIVERLLWRNARVTRLRVVDEHIERYREELDLDEQGDVRSILRRYRPRQRRSIRILITRNGHIASTWMEADSPRSGWEKIRRSVPWSSVDHLRCSGDCFHEDNDIERHVCVNRMAERWNRPDLAIDGIQEDAHGVWSLIGSSRHESTVLIGPVWAGNGSLAEDDRLVIGPAWCADLEPCPDGAAALVRPIHMIAVSESGRTGAPGPVRGWANSLTKRASDMIFAAVALLVIAPVFPIIAVLIAIEDGRPIFFAHRRQSRGGKPFNCWKFRTMVREAAELTEKLDAENRADGPQFFIDAEEDPRITKVGGILRRFHFDELPQFLNVLRGQMSIVGPRPSPDNENQYCPAWREARLSVRPGITGLWQLMRTRQTDLDFQEWIKYDIEYVQTASMWLDIKICAMTLWSIVFGKSKHAPHE